MGAYAEMPQRVLCITRLVKSTGTVTELSMANNKGFASPLEADSCIA